MSCHKRAPRLYKNATHYNLGNPLPLLPPPTWKAGRLYQKFTKERCKYRPSQWRVSSLPLHPAKSDPYVPLLSEGTAPIAFFSYHSPLPFPLFILFYLPPDSWIQRRKKESWTLKEPGPHLYAPRHWGPSFNPQGTILHLGKLPSDELQAWALESDRWL